MLEQLVGLRFDSLIKLKEKIEELTGLKVNTIIESLDERLSDCDFMIDFDFENQSEVYTIYYLKDNAERYYITEV